MSETQTVQERVALAQQAEMEHTFNAHLRDLTPDQQTLAREQMAEAAQGYEGNLAGVDQKTLFTKGQDGLQAQDIPLTQEAQARFDGTHQYEASPVVAPTEPNTGLRRRLAPAVKVAGVAALASVAFASAAGAQDGVATMDNVPSIGTDYLTIRTDSQPEDLRPTLDKITQEIEPSTNGTSRTNFWPTTSAGVAGYHSMGSDGACDFVINSTDSLQRDLGPIGNNTRMSWLGCDDVAKNNPNGQITFKSTGDYIVTTDQASVAMGNMSALDGVLEKYIINTTAAEQQLTVLGRGVLEADAGNADTMTILDCDRAAPPYQDHCIVDEQGNRTYSFTVHVNGGEVTGTLDVSKDWKNVTRTFTGGTTQTDVNIKLGNSSFNWRGPGQNNDGPKTVDLTQVVNSCLPSDATSCLRSGEFAVDGTAVTFDNPPRTFQAKPGPFIGDISTTMSFANENVQENLVRILGGCGFNGHYWVLVGPKTTFQTTTNVTHYTTEGPVTRTYHTEFGGSLPTIDTKAFPCPTDGTIIQPTQADVALMQNTLQMQNNPEFVALYKQAQATGVVDMDRFSALAKMQHEKNIVRTVEQGEAGPCLADAVTKCLLGGILEYQVRGESHDGTPFVGKVGPDLGAQSVTMTYFNGGQTTNPYENRKLNVEELSAAIADPANNRILYILGSVTDVKREHIIRNTQTGETYRFNITGLAAPIVEWMPHDFSSAQTFESTSFAEQHAKNLENAVVESLKHIDVETPASQSLGQMIVTPYANETGEVVGLRVAATRHQFGDRGNANGSALQFGSDSQATAHILRAPATAGEQQYHVVIDPTASDIVTPGSNGVVEIYVLGGKVSNTPGNLATTVEGHPDLDNLFNKMEGIGLFNGPDIGLSQEQRLQLQRYGYHIRAQTCTSPALTSGCRYANEMAFWPNGETPDQYHGVLHTYDLDSGNFIGSADIQTNNVRDAAGDLRAFLIKLNGETYPSNMTMSLNTLDVMPSGQNYVYLHSYANVVVQNGATVSPENGTAYTGPQGMLRHTANWHIDKP